MYTLGLLVTPYSLLLCSIQMIRQHGSHIAPEHPPHTIANCSLFFLFVVEMSVTRWGLLLLYPIRLKVVLVVASQMLCCIPRLKLVVISVKVALQSA